MGLTGVAMRDQEVNARVAATPHAGQVKEAIPIAKTRATANTI